MSLKIMQCSGFWSFVFKKMQFWVRHVCVQLLVMKLRKVGLLFSVAVEL